jgi:hypothetical protein
MCGLLVVVATTNVLPTTICSIGPDFSFVFCLRAFRRDVQIPESSS